MTSRNTVLIWSDKKVTSNGENPRGNRELIITMNNEAYVELITNYVKKDITISELKHENKELRKQIKLLQKKK